MDKLTTKAQEALHEAQLLATSRGQSSLMPEHLLVALLTQSDGVVPALLEQMQVDRSALESGTHRLLELLPRVADGKGETHPSREFQRLLESAFGLAKDFQDEYVSAEHLFVAIVNSPGTLTPLFRSLKIEPGRVLSSL